LPHEEAGWATSTSAQSNKIPSQHIQEQTGGTANTMPKFAFGVITLQDLKITDISAM